MNSVALPAAAPAHPLSAEADLLRKAARGDTESYDELLRRHGQAAWRLAQSVTPGRSPALAAVCDGFATAVRAARRRRGRDVGEAGFRPLVLAAVYLAAVEGPRDHAGAAEAMRSPHGLRGTRRGVAASTSEVAAAFRGLPERWRAAVWLGEVESLGTDRIAEVLGVSLPVAVQLLGRGRRALAGRFAQAGLPATDRYGDVLRPVALAVPANLAEAARVAWRDRGEVRAGAATPMAEWLAERALRPLSLAAGALVGLGLVALPIVGQATSVHSALGDGGSATSTGAIPVRACLRQGVPCPPAAAPPVTTATASPPPASPTASPATQPLAAPPVTTGTTAPTTPPATRPTTPTTAAPATQTTNLLNVANLTQTGSTIQVGVLPTSNGSVLTVTLGCDAPVALGVAVGSTTVLGCSASTTTTPPPTSTTATSPSAAAASTPSGPPQTSTTLPLGGLVNNLTQGLVSGL